MSSPEQISDDDESFEQIDLSKAQYQSESKENVDNVIDISSDENTIPYLTSDEEELPEVNLKRTNVIKNLFPPKPEPDKKRNLKEFEVPSRWQKKQVPTCPTPVVEPARVPVPGFEKMIGGVKVHLPVDPYGSQTVLMFKLITAINKGQNCLLESPTGSGKTLALLCGALAWQQQERNKLAQQLAQQSMVDYPELNRYDGAVDYIASPEKVSPEKLFGKNVFGEKSIYDKPAQNGDGASTSKRQEPLQDMDCCDEAPSTNEVKIHKKRRIGSPVSYNASPSCSDNASSASSSKIASPDCSNNASPCCSKVTSPQVTPQKNNTVGQPETPQNVRALYHLVESLQLRTSLFTDCRTPTIYYGARTHKQLQQVIKEFSRTSYCGSAKMTILSSRDHSCIREFDRNLWASKNDMCRGCVKKELTESQMTATQKRKKETNCKFYNNVKALDHSTLPPAFDLEDLVETGREIQACPYYAARNMAASAHIVFCPYNYLIEPGIRSSMQICLNDNIVIIDEAHNIEDNCRDAATFTITEEAVQSCIKELEHCTSYRYANQDCLHYLDYLLEVLKNWQQWFQNQLALVKSKPVNNNEAVHAWAVEHFIQTLNNHNIGEKHYNDFASAAGTFVQKLRDGTAQLYGVTQSTGSLVESIDTVLGYLFRENGKYKCDFKPLLIRTVYGNGDLSEARGWRNSQFNMWIEKETLSLRLLCLNPAVVFSQLKSARCIVLASGTLTPLVSLHSELATEFPLQVSPNHVIPADRVWIGTLTSCPDGHPLKCTAGETEKPLIQDALGDAVQWVCQVTPNGVLCFLPSYALMNRLHHRWQETGLWRKLEQLKHVFMENRNTRDHNDIMEDYYKYVATDKGALLFAVYRGKVSEGMDFKDHQARAVVTVGVPFPNTFDMAVKEKMNYNDRYARDRNLLSSREWLRVQAYRALNQAVGRCVRHRNDWGAVLLIDARFTQPYYTEHLSKWVRNFLGNNQHTFESLVNSANGLETFMQSMTITEREDV